MKECTEYKNDSKIVVEEKKRNLFFSIAKEKSFLLYT